MLQFVLQCHQILLFRRLVFLTEFHLFLDSLCHQLLLQDFVLRLLVCVVHIEFGNIVKVALVQVAGPGIKEMLILYSNYFYQSIKS